MKIRRKAHGSSLKKQNTLIVISTLSLILFLAVGYAAFQTVININAKGNVKEKPSITVGDKKIYLVTEDDGLYKDTSEGITRYIYKGASPQNYIYIKENGNNVRYRIYSIESDNTIKVIRDESIASMNFDADDAARRKSGYCIENYCNAWSAMSSFTNGNQTGTVSLDSSIKEYIDGTFAPTLDDKAKIVTKTWNIAGTTYNRDTLANAIADEKKTTWSGGVSGDSNIALLTASEYVRANRNEAACGTLALLLSNNSTCKSTNYLFKSSTWWLLSPHSGSHSYVLTASSNGHVGNQYAGAFVADVRPVFYLCSGITLSGSGTYDEPYEISGGSCIDTTGPTVGF